MVVDKPKVIFSGHGQSPGSGLISCNDWMLQVPIIAGTSLSINKTPPEPPPKPSQTVEALNSVSTFELSHQNQHPDTFLSPARCQAKTPIKKKMRSDYEDANDKEEATLGDDKPIVQVRNLISQQQIKKYSTRNSLSKKKQNELIDLANSDDDDDTHPYINNGASIKQLNSYTTVVQKERFRAGLAEKDIVVVSILSPLKALHIGMLPIVHNSPVISLSCVAKKLSWSLIFHDVDGRQLKEDIDSEHIDHLKSVR